MELEMAEYELSDLREGQVRIDTEFAAAKHGTEHEMLTGQASARGPYDRELGLHRSPVGDQGKFGSFTVGNMFVGTVTEVGAGVAGYEPGERVLGYGGFREVQTCGTKYLWKVPAGISWKSAVCLDPADFAMAAVRDGKVRIGDAVAVFGMGAIGLMAVQIAKLSGADPVIAVEPLANRRAAAEACGADMTLDPTACDAGLEVRLATDKRGVDVAIEYSGNLGALQAALRAVAYGGTVVCGGFPPPYPAGLDLGAEAHLNIPNILFSRACSEPDREHPRWDNARVYATCWRLICDGKVTGEPVVAPVVEFDDAIPAYMKIAEAPRENIKLGVEFQ
jgi:threonine dehydrogenase-like Zn-dependent dehydrogenase